MGMVSAGTYRGDVTPQAAWSVLSGDRKAALVDVRTIAEIRFVGVPDLLPVGRQLVCVEWQSFPAMAVDPAFADKVDAELHAIGVGPDDPVFFLCRSGGRSAAAAAVTTSSGYSQCFNVIGGFEGDADEHRHRGSVNGWKVAGLPWFQS